MSPRFYEIVSGTSLVPSSAVNLPDVGPSSVALGDANYDWPLDFVLAGLGIDKRLADSDDDLLISGTTLCDSTLSSRGYYLRGRSSHVFVCRHRSTIPRTLMPAQYLEDIRVC